MPNPNIGPGLFVEAKLRLLSLRRAWGRVWRWDHHILYDASQDLCLDFGGILHIWPYQQHGRMLWSVSRKPLDGFYISALNVKTKILSIPSEYFPEPLPSVERF